jgi:hypothetical protein
MTAAKEAGHARQADLADFIADHRPHGSLTAHATPPAWNGYRLTVACSCGVTFERWVPRDAELMRAEVATRNTVACERCGGPVRRY